MKMNPYVAMFTTAYARVHLYHLIDQFPSAVAYFDTDSLYWVNIKGLTEQVKFGVMLGEFTDEHKSCLIGEFFSTGPKCKIYQLQDPKANSKVVPTCKGITMTKNNIAKFRAAIRDMVFTPGFTVDFHREFVLRRDGMTGEVHEYLGKLDTNRTSDDKHITFTTNNNAHHDGQAVVGNKAQQKKETSCYACY
jgi:hypothetical protein